LSSHVLRIAAFVSMWHSADEEGVPKNRF
jgi:hypothetical protein